MSKKPGRRWRGGSRPRHRRGPSLTTAHLPGSGHLHKDTADANRGTLLANVLFARLQGTG